MATYPSNSKYLCFDLSFSGPARRIQHTNHGLMPTTIEIPLRMFEGLLMNTISLRGGQEPGTENATEAQLHLLKEVLKQDSPP